jgi:hypothetical protein
MPRKTLKEQQKNSTVDKEESNPTDSKNNRIRGIMNDLIGIEDSEDLMLAILEVLTETVPTPEVGRYYTFIYKPKTNSLRYDAHPLVAVTNLFNWGFRGINFHWQQVRQYTWEEVAGNMHVVNEEEIKDLKSIPYGLMRLNN